MNISGANDSDLDYIVMSMYRQREGKKYKGVVRNQAPRFPYFEAARFLWEKPKFIKYTWLVIHYLLPLHLDHPVRLRQVVEPEPVLRVKRSMVRQYLYCLERKTKGSIPYL